MRFRLDFHANMFNLLFRLMFHLFDAIALQNLVTLKKCAQSRTCRLLLPYFNSLINGKGFTTGVSIMCGINLTQNMYRLFPVGKIWGGCLELAVKSINCNRYSTKIQQVASCCKLCLPFSCAPSSVTLISWFAICQQAFLGQFWHQTRNPAANICTALPLLH